MRFGRTLVSAALVGGAVFGPPGIASAAAATGTCVVGTMTANPPAGAVVSPSQVIRIDVTETVTGRGPVVACARLVLMSDALDFVSAEPGGSYSSTPYLGKVIGVSWAGPHQPGVVLNGTIVVQVSAAAVSGTTIGLSSPTSSSTGPWQSLDYTVG